MFFYGTNPETASRWATADASPQGTAAWKKGQADLEAWIGEQVAQAQASGQLDINDRGALSSFLRTLGVTNEKGGGMFLWNKFMGNHGGGLSALQAAMAKGGKKLGGIDPMNGMQQRGRSALMDQYGGDTLGALMGGRNWSNWNGGGYGIR